VNAAGSCRPNEDRENIPQLVENLAAQAQQPQDPQYVDMGYYGMAHFPLPQGQRDHIIGDIAGIVQGVPAQAQVAPAPVCTNLIFGVHIPNHTSTKGD
jgi:hypothetical protein